LNLIIIYLIKLFLFFFIKTEAACLVLSIDETIKAPKSTNNGGQAAQAYPGGGRGRPM